MTSSDEPGAELAATLSNAVEAARTGDFAPMSELAGHGPSLAPHLRPYLADDSDDVRLAVVSVIAALKSEAAVPLLVIALADRQLEIQERAAAALYALDQPAATATLAGDVAAALRSSVAGGNKAAAAILLLAYFPGDETVQVLSALLGGEDGRRTKLHPWSPSVPVALPALVALSRVGPPRHRATLLASIDGASLDDLTFLLSVMREVDAPAVLHALAPTLSDTREIEGGVPSGAQPRRRLADAAVDAFAGRLRLGLSFPLNDAGRYSATQRSEVGRKIGEVLPR